jgi:alpha-galactosidase
MRYCLRLGPVLGVLCSVLTGISSEGAGLDRKAVEGAPGAVVAADGEGADSVKVERRWSGDLCRSELVNAGERPVKIKEVVLFAIPHALPPETLLYGESFQMLSQTGGTLGRPVNIGNYTDRKHYKMPQPEDATVVHGMLTLSPPEGDRILMGFTSCRRFMGRFHVRPASVEVVLDTEGLALAPGERWELEEFRFATGPDRPELLTGLADRLRANHPPRMRERVPAGWCSWYCFGPRVTDRQILENLDVIAESIPGLKYIQVDDGYQKAMGDWLESGKAFDGGVRRVLERIGQEGFEPAIWVAPFIAERESDLFRQHPDWFIRDDSGQPLPADRVTFGGWRRGPWFALDGTHPEVQKHLESLFRTMREEWGCTYFKLDANFWGAMHGGHLRDPKATRIEAYRRGMEAILRGAGDAFILGCNHPIWPSLGLIDGSRSSGDISRKWPKFAQTARENLSRNWQNGQLWWNDPDCALLTGPLTEDEYQFHATAVFASGGLILSGDDLTKIAPDRLAMLRKLLPPTGQAARFDDETLRVGRISLFGRELVCVFNGGDDPLTLEVRLLAPCHLRDFWTGRDLGKQKGSLKLEAMPPHSARLLMCTPEGSE